ncbi:MAG: CHAD domain-containing protein [Marivibrio sp.]|uniref:CYTH and CHAD domain-containing protein n=1 Tax=Marivibrio sp. TaxID=2039719 RepID=UPI0032EEBD8B
MSEQEIELKLVLGARAAAKLRRDPQLHRLKRGRAANRRLIAVYFDTDDLALKDAGVALRLRQEGRRRVQTVKAPAGPAGGVQTRVEVNAPIAGDAPDLDLISDDGVRTRVRKACAERSLRPVFSTDVKRTLWMIEWGDSLIELALDHGEIRSDGASAPETICEAELELKGGSPADLLAFAHDLRERVRFSVGAASKAARGYALFLGAPTPPKKAGSPDLDPTMSARQALATILSGGAAQLLANEPVVRRGEDSEGVHQARVAVRRTRAALSAFKPIIEDAHRKPLAKRLRWMQGALGPARDWDVFLEETLAPLLRERPGGPGLEALQAIEAQARKRRKAGYKQAVKAFEKKRCQRLILDLDGWAFTDNPKAHAVAIGRFAAELLDARHARILVDAKGDPSALPVEEQHQLRIEIKNLRYALEFFQSLYPAESRKPMLKAAKKLQDCLGGLNDAAVAHGLLQELAGADDPREGLDAEAVDRIEGFQAARVEAGLAKLAACWETFQAAPAFWRDDAREGGVRSALSAE